MGKQILSLAIVVLSALTLLTACGAKYASVAEYAQTSEVQQIAKDASSDEVECSVYAEGDTLVLQYTLSYDIEDEYLSTAADVVKEAFDEEDKSTFTDMKNELKLYCNVADPHVVMRYYTSSNKLIIEYEPEDY